MLRHKNCVNKVSECIIKDESKENVPVWPLFQDNMFGLGGLTKPSVTAQPLLFWIPVLTLSPDNAKDLIGSFFYCRISLIRFVQMTCWVIQRHRHKDTYIYIKINTHAHNHKSRVSWGQYILSTGNILDPAFKIFWNRKPRFKDPELLCDALRCSESTFLCDKRDTRQTEEILLNPYSEHYLWTIKNKSPHLEMQLIST